MKAKILWPLLEKYIEKATRSIRWAKGIIAMALSADSTATVVEIHKATTDNQAMLSGYIALNKEQDELRAMREWLESVDGSHGHQVH